MNLGPRSRYVGEEIFREHLADPIPPSVRIINSEDSGGISVNLFLHFGISASDLQAILAAGGYMSEDAISTRFFDNFRPPSWWNPESLGSGRVQWVWEESTGADSTWRRYLIHDPEKEEAFFLVFYYY